MDFQKVGLIKCDAPRCFEGYTTVSTFRGEAVRLIDMEGREVHSWNLPGKLGSLAYLLPGGCLLCSVQVPTDIPLTTARGGRILELSWEGDILWEFTDHTQHHDFRRLANGNTVYIGWRALADEFAARVGGGIPGTEAEGKMYEDYFREVSSKGEIVWEWSMSLLTPEDYPISHGLDRGEFGHANTICPMSDGTFIVNFRNLDMMAVLDPARGFIWEARNQYWGRQHDPQSVTVDGEDRILFFANGAFDKPKPQRSAVVELDARTGEEAWRWEAGIPWTFYSHVMGGVQRLANGNTLVCESVNGRIFEVHRESTDIVWDYINPDFSAPFPLCRDPANAIFRAYRYAADSEELAGTPLASS
ncbi:MAG: arylsulfotransferase family protein [Pseudomonadota bacterium]